ncbi:MAG TPA: TadE family protein [Alphaproteobacteria bacterium]|jgi:Flp pilus assembly protein TadG|nr:TadE family protein [Alphaproteobacteria bacterium]
MMRLFRRLLPRLGEGGSVAVEYALCLPFLMAMMYGIIEVSHYAYLRTTMENVAHDAVRYASIHSSQATTPATASDVKSFTSNELSSLGLNPDGTGGTTVTVTYTPDNTPGNPVKVYISYPFVPFMGGFNRIPGTAITFTTLSAPVIGSAQLTIMP